ncbi:PAS/PAC sensor signal transduction histidine kinase [Paenibacillus taihuensis]|uniref:histidine kinase n=1 Tax=Paenibacillus taihuensis TaxID=1156355 RepID=A0A3D9RXV8_9BACL|nr:PAS domain-containing sensor histidine kinase [Paenibacillus taihuensis]REE81505.1 PAS/PAC sensor signal transduction histidine kinase [Paenibacillus taihuensis]
MANIDNQSLYRSLFDHNPEALLALNLDGVLVEINSAAVHLLGYEADELRGMEMNSLMTSECRAEYRQLFADVAADGVHRKCVLVMMHREGRRLALQLSGFPFFTDGMIAGIYIQLRESAASEQLSDDLQLTRGQLSFYIDNVEEACLVLDTNLHVLRMNRAFENIFGWREEEIIGFQIPTIPEHRKSEKEAIRDRVLASRQVISYEAERLRKDGSPIIVSNYASPLLDSKGNAAAIVLISKDITERRRMIEALQESENRLRIVINAMPDLVYFKDGEGRWIEANQIALATIQLDKDSYKGFTDLELAEKCPHLRDAFLLSAQGDEVAWARRTVVRAERLITNHQLGESGEEKIYDIVKVPLFHEDGRRHGLLTIGRDITELKRTEELLRTSDKLAVVGQLAAGIAHEIRNPLTTIKGFISLLNSQTTEKNNWYLDVMRGEIEQMEWITSQFMSVAKPQSMSYKLHRMELVLAQVASLLYPLALMNNVQIHLETEADVPDVECDENQLIQLFINVVKNAIEAMSAGGQIEIIITQRDERHVSIRVTDHGCGIPADRIARLGEPFYSMKEKGTGLGLMICYKIVKEHGGKISIESELGLGTTVDVVLPFKGRAR